MPTKVKRINQDQEQNQADDQSEWIEMSVMGSSQEQAPEQKARNARLLQAITEGRPSDFFQLVQDGADLYTEDGTSILTIAIRSVKSFRKNPEGGYYIQNDRVMLEIIRYVVEVAGQTDMGDLNDPSNFQSFFNAWGQDLAFSEFAVNRLLTKIQLEACGSTLLLHSLTEKRLNIVSALLKKGVTKLLPADATVKCREVGVLPKDSRGFTLPDVLLDNLDNPLLVMLLLCAHTRASFLDFLQSIECLIEGGITEMPTDLDFNEIHFPLAKVFVGAAGHGKCPNTMGWLLEQGVDINAIDPRLSESALHNAAKSKHANVVRWLLNRGADANVQTASGASALHYAAHARSLGCVRALTEHGAQPDLEDNTGASPLDILLFRYEALPLQSQAESREILTYLFARYGGYGLSLPPALKVRPDLIPPNAVLINARWTEAASDQHEREGELVKPEDFSEPVTIITRYEELAELCKEKATGSPWDRMPKNNTFLVRLDNEIAGLDPAVHGSSELAAARQLRAALVAEIFDLKHGLMRQALQALVQQPRFQKSFRDNPSLIFHRRSGLSEAARQIRKMVGSEGDQVIAGDPCQGAAGDNTAVPNMS